MDKIYALFSDERSGIVAITVVLFTIVTKLLMTPLTIKQQKFSKLSSLMNPELQAIQKKYGSIEAWGKVTDGIDSEPDVEAVIFGFTEMLNEGIEIDNDENGTDLKPLTAKQVGRIITEVGMNNALEKLQKTVVDSTQSAEKNA